MLKFIRKHPFLVQWLFLGLALLSLGGYGSYVLTQDYQRIDRQEREWLAARARIIEENLARQLEAINFALASIRDEAPIWKAQPEGWTLAAQRLKIMGDLMTGVRTLLVINPDGTVFASNRDELRGMDFSQRDYFRRVVRHPNPDTLYVGEPFQTVLGVFAMNMARMLAQPNGEFGGIVAATLEPKEFSVLLNSVRYAPDMASTLVHGGGKIFLHLPDRPEVMNLDLSQPGTPGTFFARHLASGQSASVMTGVGGLSSLERMAALRTIQPAALHMDQPLIVTVARDLEPLFAPWRSRVREQSALFGALAVASILGLIAYQRRQWQRAAAERALRESEARLQRVLDGTNDGFWDWNLTTGAVLFSRRWAEMLGYDLAEIEPHVRSWENLVHPDDLPRCLAALDAHFAGEAPRYQCEHRMRAKNGEWRWILDRGKVTARDAGGQPLSMAGTHTDITDRKQAEQEIQALNAGLEQRVAERTAELETEIATRKHAEQALARERELLQRLIDSIPVMITQYDPHINILRLNREFERLIGWSTESACQMDLMEHCYPDPDYRRQVQAFMDSLEPGWRDFQVSTRWGGVVESSWANIRLSDATHVGIGIDITERKRAEEALRHSRDQLQAANLELARAARLKDEFLASMSHELRTPLTAILGLTEALQDAVYGPVAQAQQVPLRMIEDSGRHLLALINDILDLAKIEAGQVELVLAPCVMAEVGQASLYLIKGMAGKKRQQLGFNIAPPDLVVEADGRRLKQMLVNLLGNAVKFTPDGGRIGLEITGDPDTRVVRLAVWDTGIGIAAEDLPKLFQNFVQLDARLERQYQGTGLGLALVKHLAALHGGEVSVESAPGQGSRFTITLPWTAVASAAATADRTPEACPAPAAPVVPSPILLAEDNDLNRMAYAGFLRARGYRVVEAMDGLAAVEQARAVKPALVLMDIQMPGLSGLEAIRRLRADPDPAVAGAPIIALTALAMPGDRERCLAAGANEYLSKPVGMKDLLAAIAALLAA